ncbi:cadherin-like domain-containing protein [Thermoleptolyngbya sp. PKUAC-SCTB121]|uniref:cadherin-like domain-containing protein n=1 Tax=Thermoleptolyngbya sp. PKUAC-SCTB121 TaxID=2811482 RepID=UPI001965D0C8|nr:Ig-like domain-containing protein [Thermoleptolyngbya sp. PKUAC-SCTB121]
MDSAVENVQQLLQNTSKHIKVAVIDRTQNGVETLIQWLQQFPHLQQVHILAHGAPGRIFLGNTQLSQDTLQAYQEALRRIRQRRKISQAPLDLLLYSCNVAAGEVGTAFVESLHRLTGANIAASSGPVGNAALGGTWHLDTQTSAFPIALPFATAAAHRYPGLLAPVSISGIIANYVDLPDNASTYTANELGNPDGDGTANEPYTYNFPVGTNNNLVISGFTAASSTYNLVQLVDQLKLRRVPNANVSNAGGRQIFWYEIQNLNASGNVLNLKPSRINTMEEALLGTVINRGVDNIFANQGDNNINNIERIDFIASGGLTAPIAANLNDIGFLLLERGGNDPLTIAAITAVDASGNPTAYGPLQVVSATAWGASSFNLATAVLNDMGSGGNPRFSSNIGSQNIKGVFLSYSALGIGAGQTFFGYSVFPNDVGTDLVNLTDAVLNSSSASGQGGLDLVAGGGIFVKSGSNLAPTLNLDPFNITGGPDDFNFQATFTGSAVAITAPNASGFDPNNSGADIETLTISVNAPNGNSEALIIGGTPFILGTANSGTVTIGSTTFAVSVAVSGTTATLTITRNGGGDLSNAAVSALLQSLQYNNTASSPNTTPRVFSFVANDGAQNSNTVTSTIGISVSSVNNPPVDDDENLSVAEDNPLTGNLLSNATDVDGDTLSITQFTIGSTTYTAGDTANIPGVGTLTINANGTFTFTPAPNYNGPVPPVSYVVGDGNGGTDTSTLSITVTPVNDPPIDGDETLSVAEDNPLTGNLLSNATDVDGDTLSITQFTIGSTTYTAGDTANIPGVGTLTINANGTFTFTPAPNYNGPVPPVSYVVSDGNGGTDTSTLSITVTPVNDPPVDGNENLSVAEDTPLSGNLLSNATDVDGDTLSITQFTIGSTTYTAGDTANIPGVGTLTINANGTFTFTPAPNYNGPVPPVSYVVSDGNGGTDTSTLSITVTPVNDPPVDGNENLSVAEDTPLSGNLLSNATDVDGDTLSITQFTIGSTTYTAGDTANIPGVGTLTINANGTFTFTPALNYNGPVPPVSYVVSDGNGGTDTSTLSITVTPVNDPPVDGNENLSVAEDTPLSGNLLSNATDVDGDTLSITQFTIGSTTYTAGDTANIPGVGTLTINANGTFTFTPAPNYNGPVPPVSYVVSDGNGGTDTSTLSITVTPVNDPPVDGNETLSVAEDTPLSGNLLSNATDVDGDTLSITQFTIGSTTYTAGDTANIPGVGTLTINANGTFTFTPAPNYNGPVPPVSYVVSDGNGGTDTSTLSITVTPVNDPPIDDDETLSVAKNTPLSGNLLDNATDADGDALSVIEFTIDGDTYYSAGDTATIPGIGTLTINTDGTFTFIPVTGYVGPVPPVIYTVMDSSETTDVSTLSITVIPANSAPIDGNETLSVARDNPLSGNLLSNATDADGDTLSITEFTIGTTKFTAGQTANLPGIGTLTINANGTFTFTPATGYTGPVPPVTYTVSDGNGGTDTSTLSITVTGTDGNPALTIDLDADDSSGVSGRDYQTRFVQGFPAPVADIDLTINSAGSTILQQAVITLVNRPNGTLESLSIRGALPPGITASAYNPATGQLILSGAASLADYKRAIATITYNNSARSVDTTNRTITVVVSNGTLTSPPATTTIEIASQNIINGSSGSDTIIGTDGDDVLNGFSDRDIINGRGGNDIINGGSDPDVLRGDEGDDILNGGTGNDDLDGGDGNDIINGGGGNDLIHGRAGDDLLNGGRGRDRIFGGTGRDTLNGGGGNDLLVGDEGDDVINGGRGNDRIIGGAGRDRLTGGQGNDLFIYRSKSEFGDVITDFEIVRDRIDLRAIFRGHGSMSNIRLRQVGADTQVDVKIGGQFATLGVLEAVNANTLQARHFIF